MSLLVWVVSMLYCGSARLCFFDRLHALQVLDVPNCIPIWFYMLHAQMWLDGAAHRASKHACCQILACSPSGRVPRHQNDFSHCNATGRMSARRKKHRLIRATTCMLLHRDRAAFHALLLARQYNSPSGILGMSQYKRGNRAALAERIKG